MTHPMGRSLAGLVVAGFSAALSAWAQDYEAVPSLKSSDFLAPEWLSSDLHKIAPEARFEQALIVFSITSAHGTEEVAGIEMTKRRVREIHATEVLREKRLAGAAVEGITDEGISTAKTLVGAAKKPVQTIFNIPKGLTSIAKRSASSVENQVKTGGNYTGGPIKDWFKVSEPKLDLARELGVDPYSDYEPLQKQLGRLAGTSAVSGIGLRLIVPGDGIIAAADAGEAASKLNDVYRTLPSQLFQENVKMLEELGIPKERASQFLASDVYSPADQSVIIRSLAEIKPAQGVDAYLDAAQAAPDQAHGFMFRRSTELLLAYHRAGNAVSAVGAFGNFPVAIGKSGRLILPLYSDRVYWTEGASNVATALKAGESEGGFSGTDLVATGEFSERSQRELSSKGFKLIPKQPLSAATPAN